MTGLVILPTDHRIFVASDGAVTDSASGALLALMSKQQILWDIGAVVAQRGIADFARYAIDHMEGCFATFDDLLRAIEERLPQIFRNFRSYLADTVQDEHANSTLYLSGWSVERQQLITCRISTREKEFSGRRWSAFELVQVDDLIWMPAAHEHLPLLSIEPDLEYQAGQFASLAVRLVCASRYAETSFSDGTTGTTVGGFVQLTTVSPGGRLMTDCVHRWPDSIGQVIDRTKGPALPPGEETAAPAVAGS